MLQLIIQIYQLAKHYIMMIGSSLLATLIWAIGGFDVLIKALLFLMTLDYITGVWIGYRTKTLNSTRAYKGLEKKIMVLIIICCATVMEKLMPKMGIRIMVGIFYSATEILSVIENAAKLGVPFPNALKRALEQLKDDPSKKI